MQSANPLISVYQSAAAHPRLRAALLALLGVCLLTVSAKIKVPYYPVPMTLQTLVVLLLPALCSAPAALGGVIAYLALGAAGAPVFSGGGGAAYFTGATGGFLVGFAAAAAFIAFWARRGALNTFGGALAVFLAAAALLFACGLGQLALVVGDWHKALALGLYPFIIGDISKAVLAAALVALLRRKPANHNPLKQSGRE